MTYEDRAIDIDFEDFYRNLSGIMFLNEDEQSINSNDLYTEESISFKNFLIVFVLIFILLAFISKIYL